MRKIIIAILCSVAMAGSVFFAFTLGRKRGQNDYFLLSLPSFITMLLDLRDSVASIPEPIRAENNIKVDKYDILLWGYGMAYDAQEEKFVNAYKRMAKSDGDVAKMKQQFERAMEIGKDVSVGCLLVPQKP